MQEQYRHFLKTLQEIIQCEFGGKQAAFCDATGMEKSIASKILNGRPPHPRHLQIIIPALSRESGLALFAAWTKDIIDYADYERLFGDSTVTADLIHAASYHRRNDDAEKVLAQFRHNYMDDREFLEWLLHLGRMLEIIPPQQKSVALKLAEDSPLYDGKPI
jgi:hypothetical protein